MEGRHHGEEARPRTPCRPIQVGVVLGVDVQLVTVRGDHVEADDALTRRSVHPAVPAVPALEQVAADSHALAVAGGEEQPERIELGRQDAAALAGSDHRDLLVGVDGGLLQAAHVEQHRAVAQMVGRPAVAAGLDADLLAVGLGVAHGGDHVLGVDRLHDDVRVAVRHPLIPHRRPTCGFIPVIAAEEVPRVGKCRHPNLHDSHCEPL